jgi:hypothetical protein
MGRLAWSQVRFRPAQAAPSAEPDEYMCGFSPGCRLLAKVVASFHILPGWHVFCPVQESMHPPLRYGLLN